MKARAEEAKRRGQEAFSKLTREDADLIKSREKALQADVAKSAKLKALRLAKEAETKQAELEAKLAAPKKKGSAKAAAKAEKAEG